MTRHYSDSSSSRATMAQWPPTSRPQYLKAEEEYRRAANGRRNSLAGGHAARDAQAQGIRKTTSRAEAKDQPGRKELEAERKSPEGGSRRTNSTTRRRDGNLDLGGPNSGKSRLLASLTRATPEVAPIPLRTRQPLPGMMPWEDVMVQLIDTPPITKDYHGAVHARDDSRRRRRRAAGRSGKRRWYRTASRVARSFKRNEDAVGAGVSARRERRRAFVYANAGCAEQNRRGRRRGAPFSYFTNYVHSTLRSS